MKTSSIHSAPPKTGTATSAAARSLAARLGLNVASDRPPAVVVTEKALAALRDLALPAGAVMRIGVVAGGCSGHTYSAAVDACADPADVALYDSGSLRIVADPRSAAYLDGLRIDYSDDLIRSGFRFSNSKAGGSCGCGASFKASP